MPIFLTLDLFILTDLTNMKHVALASKHFCNGTIKDYPYDAERSLKLIFKIPAIMLPPLSVAKFMMIYKNSFCLSSLMNTSLLTVNRLVEFDCISWEIGLPMWVKVSLQGNLTASLSYLMVRLTSQDSSSSMLYI